MGNRPVPTYKDYQEAAAIGVCKKYVDHRIKYYGWSLERAITTPVGTSWKGKEKHGDLPKLAIRNGIKKQDFYNRIRRGWEPLEAATTPYGKKKTKFSEYIELRKQNGISAPTFHRRVERGMDPYEAATKPVRGKKNIIISEVKSDKPNGSKHWINIAKKNGIKTRTFYSRIDIGWSYEEAATKPTRKYKEVQQIS